MIACGLHRALERAGIPIVGVSIGRESDRSTWAVHFKAEATAQQQADAAALVASYDLAADTVLRAELAEKEIAFKALGSLARVTWEHLPGTKPSWPEFLQRWKAIYLSLS